MIALSPICAPQNSDVGRDPHVAAQMDVMPAPHRVIRCLDIRTIVDFRKQAAQYYLLCRLRFRGIAEPVVLLYLLEILPVMRVPLGEFHHLIQLPRIHGLLVRRHRHSACLAAYRSFHTAHSGQEVTLSIATSEATIQRERWPHLL